MQAALPGPPNPLPEGCSLHRAPWPGVARRDGATLPAAGLSWSSPSSGNAPRRRVARSSNVTCRTADRATLHGWSAHGRCPSVRLSQARRGLRSLCDLRCGTRIRRVLLPPPAGSAEALFVPGNPTPVRPAESRPRGRSSPRSAGRGKPKNRAGEVMRFIDAGHRVAGTLRGAARPERSSALPDPRARRRQRQGSGTPRPQPTATGPGGRRAQQR